MTGKLGLAVTIIEIDAQPSGAQIDNVIQAAPDRRLVLIGVNDLATNTKQLKLIKDLVASGNPVIAIAYRNPFDAMLLPDSVSVLVTYGFNWPMFEALTNVLTGQSKALGSLPVVFPK